MTEVARGATSVAGTDEIRSHFPALRRRHAGQPVAYFDGPGGTQVPHGVVDAMADYLYQHNANTAWAYPSSEETDEALLAARRTMADFLNASPDEIAFGANMTTITFHVARAIGHELGPGDELVVTELDHHGNVAPWRRLATERGVTVRTVRMRPETGDLDWEDFERQLSAKTRLVAIGAASNVLGTVVDVRRAAALARASGGRSREDAPMVFVDAVHYAPHLLPDVRGLDCDFLVCSAYKFYGPHVAIFFGRRAAIEALDVPKLLPAPETPPERLETGTQNHEGIVGAAAAVDFLASLAPGDDRRQRLRTAFDALHRRGSWLVTALWEGLARLPGVRLYGPRPGVTRTPTVAFAIDGVAPVDVARRLAASAIFASHGDFYAPTVVERLGHAAGGLVRAGCVCYTTPDEVSRLVDAVAAIVESR